MKKKKMNEGLMDAIVGGIMTWATKREIKSDPEFQKTLRNYTAEIDQLSRDIESELSRIRRKHPLPNEK